MKLVTIKGEREVLGRNAAMKLMLKKFADETRAARPRKKPIELPGFLPDFEFEPWRKFGS